MECQCGCGGIPKKKGSHYLKGHNARVFHPFKDKEGPNKGRKFSLESRRHMSLAHIGYKHSEEVKHKMSLVRMGNTYSLGHKHSEAHKLAIRQGTTGVMMARMLANGCINPNSFWGLKGVFFSEKIGCTIPHESYLELLVYQLLEKEPMVKVFSRCTTPISYGWNGGKCLYLPDIFVELISGEQCIIEVKQKSLANRPKEVAKAGAAREFCLSKRMKFYLLLGNRDRRKQEGLKLDIKDIPFLSEEVQG